MKKTLFIIYLLLVSFAYATTFDHQGKQFNSTDGTAINGTLQVNISYFDINNAEIYSENGTTQASNGIWSYIAGYNQPIIINDFWNAYQTSHFIKIIYKINGELFNPINLSYVPLALISHKSNDTLYLNGTPAYEIATKAYAVSVSGGNLSFNETYSNTLYAPISTVSDNSSWNQTYASTLYADISVTGGNSSWNQTHASTLYADISVVDTTIGNCSVDSSCDPISYDTERNVLLADMNATIGGKLATADHTLALHESLGLWSIGNFTQADIDNWNIDDTNSTADIQAVITQDYMESLGMLSVSNVSILEGLDGTNGTDGINGTNGIDGTNGTVDYSLVNSSIDDKISTYNDTVWNHFAGQIDSIGNWSDDKDGYYTSLQTNTLVFNANESIKEYSDAQDSLQDECSEITGCVEYATVNDTDLTAKNIFPTTTLTYDLGSGEERWRYLYVQNISAEYLDVLNGITANTMNITTTYIEELHVITINGSYIHNPFTTGYMDIRASPWWLSGADLEIDQNLDVNTDLNVDGNAVIDGSLTVGSIDGNVGCGNITGADADFCVDSDTIYDDSATWTTANFTRDNVSNWDTAYGWGNHALAGYLTTSTDTNESDRVNALIGDCPNGYVVNGVDTNGSKKCTVDVDTNTQLSDADILALGYNHTDTLKVWINANDADTIYDDSNIRASIPLNNTYNSTSDIEAVITQDYMESQGMLSTNNGTVDTLDELKSTVSNDFHNLGGADVDTIYDDSNIRASIPLNNTYNSTDDINAVIATHDFYEGVDINTTIGLLDTNTQLSDADILALGYNHTSDFIENILNNGTYGFVDTDTYNSTADIEAVITKDYMESQSMLSTSNSSVYLDNTDAQTLSYDTGTDVISITGGNSIDISEVDTDTNTYNSTADIQAVAVGGEVSGTVGDMIIDDIALDDQYYKIENPLQFYNDVANFSTDALFNNSIGNVLGNGTYDFSDTNTYNSTDDIQAVIDSNDFYTGADINSTIAVLDQDTTFTADEGNITLVGTVFHLLKLDLNEMDNTNSGFITTAVSTLANYFTKTVMNTLLADINSTINTKLTTASHTQVLHEGLGLWGTNNFTQSDIDNWNSDTNTYNSTSDIQAVAVGGELSGTVGNAVVSNTALDDQYYQIENPLQFYNSIENFTLTLTDGKLCMYNSSNSKIECTVEPVVDTDTNTYNSTADIQAVITQSYMESQGMLSTNNGTDDTLATLQTTVSNDFHNLGGTDNNLDIDQNVNTTGSPSFVKATTQTFNNSGTSDFGDKVRLPEINITNGDNSYRIYIDGDGNLIIGG